MLLGFLIGTGLLDQIQGACGWRIRAYSSPGGDTLDVIFLLFEGKPGFQQK